MKTEKTKHIFILLVTEVSLMLLLMIGCSSAKNDCEMSFFGPHCESCQCLHGKCNDGIEGDGSCTCERDWKGIDCNIRIIKLSAGSDHTCTIDDLGVFCWGNNGSGQTDVPQDLVNPVAIAVGSVHTCALDDNGVHCWGRNDYGQTNVPPGLVNPVAVEGGYGHTCALDDNGLHCWGFNWYGQATVPRDLVFSHL
jgi:alpha-tubulin suppressor-like RCC1 family protein